MTGFRRPVAAELAARTLDAQLIRPAQKLVVDDFSSVDVPEALSVLPRPLRVNCTAEEIVFAEEERAEMWLGRGDPRSGDERDFVHRRYAQDHSAVPIGIRQYARIGDERLRAQNALRLRAPHLCADVSPLQGEIAADYGFLGGHVLLGGKASNPLPHAVPRNSERRVRIY